MAKDPDPANPADVGLDTTMPQWQPPAGATRSVVIAPEPGAPPPAAAEVAGARGDEPAAPGVSGTRVGARAQAIGLEHTIQAGPSLAPPRPLKIGDILADRYVIEEHISSGGFGAVYRASDRQIRHHQVAIKLLHVPAADEQARQTALRELALIAAVSHPSVVQFKDYGWYEGRLWFAMPWYRGETLSARYRDSEGPIPMSRAQARPLFERLARGLAAMHEVGIHHHDIKPENIFVADIAGFEGGLPVLLDLGIAAARGEGPKGLTVEYAAPEVASAALGHRDRPISASADVFSLALVLRNLLEPETALPSEGELLPMLHRRATERVEAPRKRELRYLQPAFERWLSLDPAERPMAAELAAEFALLTAPEERREARARLLRRIVPIVLAAAAIVTLLLFQVREQKTELTVQRTRLSQEMQHHEELRQQSTEQLLELEKKSAQIGTQGQQLQRAISIARTLDGQLERAEERADGLNRNVRKLTGERNQLTLERDGLARERDELEQTRQKLVQRRAELEQERDQLVRARDGLTAERDAITRERDRLEQERNSVVGQRNDAIRQRDRLQAELGSTQRQLEQTNGELDGMRKSFAAARDELKQLRARMNELDAERQRIDSARSALEAQLRALQRQRSAAQPAPAPEAAPAPAPEAAPAPNGSKGRMRLRKP